MSFATGNQEAGVARGGTFGPLTSQAAEAGTPTSEIRAELEAAGVALPTDEEVREMAQGFYEGLEAFAAEWGEKNQGSMSWHNVFKSFDEDDSGHVTYDAYII